eukprot:TRINITY_DN1450_c0_g1_i5.p1 TRINITY_DN1450_c0_g1~~TRINITY_DN1450_c0_g1_i5.p1  ORF type:complete len:596 (+),score=134.56 TRINITY_DN1450_c0_g1_i5:66-1790(+)
MRRPRSRLIRYACLAGVILGLCVATLKLDSTLEPHERPGVFRMVGARAGSAFNGVGQGQRLVVAHGAPPSDLAALIKSRMAVENASIVPSASPETQVPVRVPVPVPPTQESSSPGSPAPPDTVPPTAAPDTNQPTSAPTAAPDTIQPTSAPEPPQPPPPQPTTDDDGDDLFITEHQSYIKGEKEKHDRESPATCKRWVTRQQIEEFRASEKVTELGTLKVRSASGSVSEFRSATFNYINTVMDYAPVITVHRHVVGTNMFDTNVKGSMEVNEADVITVNHTIYRGMRFDEANPYEAHHAYFNAYLAMRMLRIDPRDVQFVHNDLRFKGEADRQVWNTLNHRGAYSEIGPIYGQDTALRDSKPIHFTTIIESQSAGTSLLVTNSARFGSSLKGRGGTHICKSPLILDFIGFMRKNAGVPAPVSPPRGPPYNVVWSSRAGYTHVDGTHKQPVRHIAAEDALLDQMRSELGGDYVISKVNFAAGMTFAQILRLMSTTHILAGVHGAGLIYSLYLPPHAGLVEIFGGNRASSNKHYTNIAKYVDLHYESFTARRLDIGVKDGLVNVIRRVAPRIGNET